MLCKLRNDNITFIIYNIIFFQCLSDPHQQRRIELFVSGSKEHKIEGIFGEFVLIGAFIFSVMSLFRKVLPFGKIFLKRVRRWMLVTVRASYNDLSFVSNRLRLGSYFTVLLCSCVRVITELFQL